MTNGPLYPPFYPPVYPVAPAPRPVAEELRVNGVDLGSYCFMTSDISGLLTVPGKRGEDAIVPGRHGAIRTPRKRYDVGEIVLPMWVVGCRPDGSVPSHGLLGREFFARRDELLQLFHADEVELTFKRADEVEMSTTVEVVDVMDFTRKWAEPLAQVSVALRLTDPFWAETTPVSQTITGPTGTTVPLTVFAGSSAPITDPRITFYGRVNNPRLTIGERWVQFNGVIASGRELLLDCGHWSASSGAGEEWSPDARQVFREPGPSWFEIPPSDEPVNVTFTHTGGNVAQVEIAGRRKFLTA